MSAQYEPASSHPFCLFSGYVFREALQWVFTTMNASAGVNARCLQAYSPRPVVLHDGNRKTEVETDGARDCGSGAESESTSALPGGDQTWHCMFAQYTLPFIETPLFLVQAQYDTYVLSLTTRVTIHYCLPCHVSVCCTSCPVFIALIFSQICGHGSGKHTVQPEYDVRRCTAR